MKMMVVIHIVKTGGGNSHRENDGGNSHRENHGGNSLHENGGNSIHKNKR